MNVSHFTRIHFNIITLSRILLTRHDHSSMYDGVSYQKRNYRFAQPIHSFTQSFIQSFIPVCFATRSSKASFPQNAILCFVFQIPVPSLFLNIIQQLCVFFVAFQSLLSFLQSCFRRQFLRKMWLTQLVSFHIIMCRTFLCSLTLHVCNTSSFFTRLVQLIFSIRLQTTFQICWQQSSSYWIPPLPWLSKKNCQFYLRTLKNKGWGGRGLQFLRYAVRLFRSV